MYPSPSPFSISKYAVAIKLGNSSTLVEYVRLRRQHDMSAAVTRYCIVSGLAVTSVAVCRSLTV